MNRRPLFFLLLVTLGFVAWAANPQLWTCGMHPQIIKTEPGNCPICGMKLTPIRANTAVVGGERKIKYYKSTMNPGEVSPKPGKDSMGMEMVPVYEETASSNVIQIDPATVQRMNLKTGLVTRGPVRRDIRTVGSIAFSEDGLRDITTKYEGWIEKVFVNTTWSRIKAGDPLFAMYSPDLYNAELNLLVAHGSEGDANGPLTRAALGRLQLFDVPPEFISHLLQDGKAERTFVYRAPADGVVIEKMAVVGQMMKPGERIYRTADLSSVWVLAQVYEQDLPFVKAGQTATVQSSYGLDQSYTGTVALVLPQVEEQTRSAIARIVLPNPEGALRPGMYVDVRFEAQIADSAVLVPETAILRSGDRNTVFVAKAGGAFEPREIKLGARSGNGDYEVLVGLDAGERVVTSGQFMLDSESQLREAIEKMSRSDSKVTGVANGRGAAGIAQAGNAAGLVEPSPSPATRKGDAAALTNLASAAADAAAALAQDDLAAYNQSRESVNNALNAWLAVETGPDATPPTTTSEPRNVAQPVQARELHALPLAADLKSARDTFESFSTAVTDLTRAAKLTASAGLHAFECPMAPSTGKARWLQHSSGTRNPFFGTKMPSCGEEIPGDATSAK